MFSCMILAYLTQQIGMRTNYGLWVHCDNVLYVYIVVLDSLGGKANFIDVGWQFCGHKIKAEVSVDNFPLGMNPQWGKKEMALLNVFNKVTFISVFSSDQQIYFSHG